MRNRSFERATAVVTLTLFSALAACGDSTSGGTTPSPTSTGVTTTSPIPTSSATSTTRAPDATSAADVVRAFATQVVGMHDPVIGPEVPTAADPNTVTVEVRSRRENGTADPALPATTVTARRTNGVWAPVSATGSRLRIDAPPAGTSLAAGFVTPSGVASAFEGTVVVSALLTTAAGTQPVTQAVTTAAGMQDAAWSTRLELGATSGSGFILATTTAGTDLGPPAFALVPVTFSR
jgi:hypothetical protein